MRDHGRDKGEIWEGFQTSLPSRNPFLQRHFRRKWEGWSFFARNFKQLSSSNLKADENVSRYPRAVSSSPVLADLIINRWRAQRFLAPLRPQQEYPPGYFLTCNPSIPHPSHFLRKRLCRKGFRDGRDVWDPSHISHLSLTSSGNSQWNDLVEGHMRMDLVVNTSHLVVVE